MTRIASLWLPVVGFMAGVWFLSDPVSAQAPALISDKLLHFAAYGAFGLANLRAFHGGFHRPRIWATVAALVLTAGFGALDEWRQSGVTIREASWLDWLADLGGGIAAVICLRVAPWIDAERNDSDATAP